MRFGEVAATSLGLPRVGREEAPTLSKRPYSQMSCSRALVLMAMVNRTCATRSWRGAEEASEEAGQGPWPGLRPPGAPRDPRHPAQSTMEGGTRARGGSEVAPWPSPPRSRGPDAAVTLGDGGSDEGGNGRLVCGAPLRIGQF